MTGRKACRWANYRSDCRGGNVGAVAGPNLLGEYLTVITEHYDPVTDRTRLGFAYGLPTSLPAQK